MSAAPPPIVGVPLGQFNDLVLGVPLDQFNDLVLEVHTLATIVQGMN